MVVDSGYRFLTEGELERLILMLAVQRGERGFTEADAKVVADWAEQVRMANGMLKLVLDGKLLPVVNGGEEIKFTTKGVR